MHQCNLSQNTAITRISPISVITTNWLLTIYNQTDYTSLTESDIRFKFRGKLSAYIESHILMPKQTSYQIRQFHWALDKVVLEILATGLKERNARRPEYMLPQIQLTIEPHYHSLAQVYSAELLGRIF
ncbi:hypothetical protein D1115_16985 [Vibrio alfacsensis]|uniref:Uncharacterized protein n=1 Tax=Vibrio alfacsensis TaxID=1074311 RepID=A0ABN5PKC6_9VIBR|nr:hypothetical protein [Vibrio alfacsensis]AXY02708.1 hypothetical protein D1115_16985 [Vibrio alfacsensis]